MKKENIDCWDEEDFEDIVAKTIIACYETKLKRNRKACPADRMSMEDIIRVRASGPYISGQSRVFMESEFPDKYGYFDIQNDPLPISGLIGLEPGPLVLDEIPNAYMTLSHVRQVNKPAKSWVRRSGGTLYEVLSMHTDNIGIEGERAYFTVDNTGNVIQCDQQSQRHLKYSRQQEIITHDEKYLNESSYRNGFVLQMLADQRFCWTITAQEKIAKAHIGCMLEEIKSLLYARSLPMTETGRKRPILHLVEAHKRRVRNGTDIDITSFLRGTQTVEMNGTLFKVNPPPVLKPSVSVPSQQKYFQSSNISKLALV